MDTDELTHFYVEFEWQVVAAAWQILLYTCTRTVPKVI